MLGNRERCRIEQPMICDALERRDEISVIVTLKGADAGDVEAIESVQDDFIESLPADVIVERRLVVSPQLVLRVTEPGIAALIEDYPQLMILLDETRTPEGEN